MARRKQLTKDQRNAEKAFELHKSIIENEQKSRLLFMENVSRFAELYQTQGFKDILGDEAAEWRSYLAQLEIYRNRSDINRWLKIKTALVDQYLIELDELLTAPATRIGDIAYIAKSSEEARELLSFANTYSPAQWKEEVHRRTGKHTRDDGHPHDMKKFAACKFCGLKEYVDNPSVREHIDELPV